MEDAQVQRMLAEVLIRPATSAWASAVFIDPILRVVSIMRPPDGRLYGLA